VVPGTTCHTCSAVLVQRVASDTLLENRRARMWPPTQRDGGTWSAHLARGGAPDDSPLGSFDLRPSDVRRRNAPAPDLARYRVDGGRRPPRRRLGAVCRALGPTAAGTRARTGGRQDPSPSPGPCTGFGTRRLVTGHGEGGRRGASVGGSRSEVGGTPGRHHRVGRRPGPDGRRRRGGRADRQGHRRPPGPAGRVRVQLHRCRLVPLGRERARRGGRCRPRLARPGARLPAAGPPGAARDRADQRGRRGRHLRRVAPGGPRR
jgi:hypothetical protein